MAHARYLIGDVRDRMTELPDGSIDLVLTSPPFLALRSYLPADHPDKAREIGAEPTPAAFLDTLLGLTAEWRRLLAPHGSIAVELGDTYAGSGSPGGDYAEGGMREGQPRTTYASARARANRGGRISASGDANGTNPNVGGHHMGGAGWPLDKSLCGIPHLYHLSLAYGMNLLTGQPSPAGQWRIRNVVAWCRPNPPVGALGDKFRPATSYMTIATPSRTRYFDLDAVRQPHQSEHRKVTLGKIDTRDAARSDVGLSSAKGNGEQNPNGAPPLDWWEIPSQPYAGSHYATWPAALCERPIASMVPQRVCTVCGEPSIRRVEPDPDAEVRTISEATEQAERERINEDQANRGGRKQEPRDRSGPRTVQRSVVTTGWTDCGHDAWRNGVVLDPFAGSGTTLAVATGYGRDCIGIDLDERNADLARQRVGMFLDIDYPAPVAS